MLLDRILRRLIKRGRLIIEDAKGRRRAYGETGGDDAQDLVLVLKEPSIGNRIALDPDPGLGEAYMEGKIEIRNGRIYDLLELIGRNIDNGRNTPGGISRTFGHLLRKAHQINPAHRSRKNVAHHYDLSGELYDLFLDKDRQYSCAYFDTGNLTLDEAQERKKAHIARKLMLEPGNRVLDIGCGWGGMALTLAKTAPDVHVTGVTLSTEQLGVARRRAEEAGLADRVKFELIDYRKVEGQFDRIVSVGMFEHVGVPQYQTFFDKVNSLLSPDGVAVLHSIGRNEPPGITSPFIRKYIFPGGYIPAVSEVMNRVEKSGLWTTDIEILRIHYAETVRHWRMRFLDNWDKAKAIYDERFCRMWEFYLAGSEMAFRHDGLMVFQIQMAKQIERVPLTRAYMYPDPGLAE